jgi:hypothetical protein
MTDTIQAVVTKHFLGASLAALEVTLPAGSNYSVLDLEIALGDMIPPGATWQPGGSAIWFTTPEWEDWLAD